MKIDQDQGGPPSGDKEPQGAVESSAEQQSPPSASGVRYLGGASSAAPYATRLPQWFRAFLVLLSLIIVALMLLLVISWKFESGDDRPRFTLISADRSVLFPDLNAQFTQQDRDRLAGVLGSDPAQVVHTAHDAIALKQRLVDALSVNGDPTRVVYLQLAVATANNTSFVLAQDSHPRSPTSGLTVEELVQTLAEAAELGNGNCENILLVLDIYSPTHNLMTGNFETSFSRNFAEKLKEFGKNEFSSTTPNLVVLCSTATGSNQHRAVSTTLQGSPFAFFVRYCLDGGKQADVVDRSGKQPDGLVSALELAGYVKAAVARWTGENRSRAQIADVWNYGDDFIVCPVTEGLSVSDLLASKSASETGDSAKAESVPKPAGADGESKTAGANAKSDKGSTPSQQAGAVSDSAKTVSPSKPAGEEPAQITVPSEDVRNVLLKLHQARQRTRDLRNTRAFVRHPIHFAFLEHVLYRAELSVLDGQLERTDSLLSKSSEIHEELAAFVPVDVAETSGSTAFNAALSRPTDDNLTNLLTASTPETELLLSLARSARDGEQWRQPQLIKRLVELRRLAELDSAELPPDVARLLRIEIQQARETRVLAEIAAVSGRRHEAAARAADALAKYTTGKTSGQALQGQLVTVQRGLMSLPSTIDCLCVLKHSGQATVLETEQLTNAMKAIDLFCTQPDAAMLDAAAESINRLQRSLDRLALRSIEQRKWIGSAAVLRTPLLDLDVRQRVIESLLVFGDPIRLDLDVRRRVIRFIQDSSDDERPRALGKSASQSPETPPYQELLGTFISFVHQLRKGSGELLDDRMLGGRQLDELTKELHSNNYHPATLQHWIISLQQYPLRVDDRPTPHTNFWHLRCFSLSVSYWTGSVPQTLALQEAVSETLWIKARTEQEQWSQSQQRLSRQLLPHTWIDHEDASSSTDGGTNPAFEITSDRHISVTAKTKTVVRLSLRTLRSFSEKENPLRLVWEWDHHDFPMQLEINGQKARDGYVDVEFPSYGYSMFQESSFVVSMTPGPSADEVPPLLSRDSPGPSGVIPLGVRVESGSGRSFWLPLIWQVTDVEDRPARLLLKWDDSLVPNGRIDLLPNQSIAVTLDVKIERPVAEPLRLEFLGQGKPRVLPLPDLHTKAGTHPIAPPKEGFSVGLQDSSGAIELFSGDRKLDRVEVDAAILDLAQCFRGNARFNPSTQSLSATLTRLQRSDVDAPISLELVTNEEPVGGKLLQILTEKSDEVVVDSRFPDGWNRIEAASLSVNGVPRAFRFRFNSDQLQGQIDNSLNVRFVEPQPFSRWKYQPGKREIPIHVLVDGGANTTVAFGVDLDNNGELDEFEVQLRAPFWFGRQRALTIGSAAAEGGWKVQSNVGDIRLPVNVSGLTGRHTILVEASSNGQRTLDRLPVFLLQEAPPLRIVWPPAADPQSMNQPLSVTLQANRRLLEAIDAIDIGFDNNEDGELADDERVQPLGTAPGSNLNFLDNERLNLRLKLPPAPLKAVRLLARTRSRVESEPATESAKSNTKVGQANQAPPELTGRFAQATYRLTALGRIRGLVVTSDDKPQSGVRIALGPTTLVATDKSGRFELPPVPAGVYTLTARKGNRSAVSRVTVKAAQATQAKLTLYIK